MTLVGNVDVYQDPEGSEPGRLKSTRWEQVTRRTRVHGSGSLTDEIPFTGGIRIGTGDALVLVDADRSGGITRLLHCWEFLTRHNGIAPTCISLFYVLLSSRNGAKDFYHSNWEFVKGKAQMECGTRLQAFFAMCERPCLLGQRADISPAIVEQTKAELRRQGTLSSFKAVLAGNSDQNLGTAPVANPETKRSEETRVRFD